MSRLGANFVAVGVDTMLYTEALDRRLAMFKSASAQPQGKRAIDGAGWRRTQASACASTVSGCSQRLLVDISICHLQVSQSVTTMSAPLSSI